MRKVSERGEREARREERRGEGEKEKGVKEEH